MLVVAPFKTVNGDLTVEEFALDVTKGGTIQGTVTSNVGYVTVVNAEDLSDYVVTDIRPDDLPPELTAIRPWSLYVGGPRQWPLPWANEAWPIRINEGLTNGDDLVLAVDGLTVDTTFELDDPDAAVEATFEMPALDWGQTVTIEPSSVVDFAGNTPLPYSVSVPEAPTTISEYETFDLIPDAATWGIATFEPFAYHIENYFDGQLLQPTDGDAMLFVPANHGIVLSLPHAPTLMLDVGSYSVLHAPPCRVEVIVDGQPHLLYRSLPDDRATDPMHTVSMDLTPYLDAELYLAAYCEGHDQALAIDNLRLE